MKKRLLLTAAALTLACTCSAFASEKVYEIETETETVTEAVLDLAECPLEDGVYTAEFDTNSGMFHVNETCDGRGTLTVMDGKMTIHVSLASKKIENLFLGKLEEAKKEDAEMLPRTEDTVDYGDGDTEVVYGFDIPVPALDEEFYVSLIGSKGKWYEHKVTVSDPVELLDEE